MSTSSDSVADSVNSKTFWYCVQQPFWPDAIDVLSIILEITAILLNLLVGVLFTRVTQGNRVSIMLLRNGLFNNVVDAVIKLLGDVMRSRAFTRNNDLNYAICVIWDSRFLYWLFNTIAVQCFVVFAIDRALTLHNVKTTQFVSAESRLRTYLIAIYLHSLFITIPQFFSVNLENGGCSCAPTTVNIPFLAVIYAHVFIRFFLLVVLNGILYLLSATIVINWVKLTPAKYQVDELNFLHFKQPTEMELRRLDSLHTWKTPSMCILPMGVVFIISFGFDATYQFLSGAGATTYLIGGPVQRAGTLMLLLFSNFAPLALIYSIPVLRFWLNDLWFRIIRKKHSEVIKPHLPTSTELSQSSS